MSRGRRKSTAKVSLGYLEMDIMPIVWRHGQVTVKEVFEELYPSRKLAYTTIMTVMRRLAHKGILEVDDSVVPFVYQPKVGSQELAAAVVDEVVDRLLEGSSAPLVLHYLEHGKISSAEQGKIKTLLRGRVKTE